MKAITLILALALILATPLTAFADGGLEYQAPVALPAPLDAQAENPPMHENNYNPNNGTQSSPQPGGTPFPDDLRNFPAIQGGQTIPRLQTPGPAAIHPIQEQIEVHEVYPIHENFFEGPETPFVPAPNTGRQSTMAWILASGALLGAALLLGARRRA